MKKKKKKYAPPNPEQIKFTDAYINSLVPGEYSTEEHADWMARALKAYSGFEWCVELDVKKGGLWFRAKDREPHGPLSEAEQNVLKTLFGAIINPKMYRYYMWVDELEDAFNELEHQVLKGGKWVAPIEVPETSVKAAS